jgi:ribosomal protein S18 acetylase RimI-like enzyme
MVERANMGYLVQISDCARLAYGKYVSVIGTKPAPMVADFSELIKKECVYIEKHGEKTVSGFIVFYPKEGIMHLENVAVHPDFQGQGVGNKLIEFCEARGKQLKYPFVELYTNVKMVENMMIYPKLGYVEFDRRTEDGFNRVYFRKPLI